MNRPKISLIMPIYNGEEFIENAVNMVTKQTIYNDIEFIIINGGSTDNTLKIVNKFKEQYQFIVINMEKTSSVSTARNEGLDIATGEYIMFVDCDDYIEKEHSEKLYNYAKKNDTDLLIFDYSIKKLNSNKLEKIKINYPVKTDFNKEIIIKELLLQKNGIKAYNCMKLFKTDIANKNKIRYNEEAFTVEDSLFFIQYSYYCKKINYINEYTYHYLKRVGSLSNQINIQIIDSFNLIINEIIKFLKTKKQYNKYQNECNSLYSTYYALLLNKIMYFKNTKKTKLDLIEYTNKKFDSKNKIFKLDKELYYSDEIEELINLAIKVKFKTEEIYRILEEKNKEAGYI